MPAGPSRALVLALVSATLLSACAPAINYLDPNGPVLMGSYSSAPVHQHDVRVVTFNVKFGAQIASVIDLLMQPGPLHHPDVLVLQEVDGPGVERIARASALNYVYVPSAIHPATQRDFGVAILSPWPLRDSRKVPLPHEHRFTHLRRAAAAATVDTPSGAVRVYSVHLETPVGATAMERRDQVDTLLHDAQSWTGPTIVAGDFNGRDALHPLVDAGFRWVTQRVGRTSGLFSVDHILTRGLCPTREPAAGAVSDVGHVSDHRPVWATLSSCAE